MKRTVFSKEEGKWVTKKTLKPLYIKNVNNKLLKGEGKGYDNFKASKLLGLVGSRKW